MAKKPIVLNCIPVKPCIMFGIIDPKTSNLTENKPCEVLYEDKDVWQAGCICKNRTDFMFLPIDNNKELEGLFKTSAKGETKQKCDCCLLTNSKIGFIEIKFKRKHAFQDAVQQLLTTIKIFSDNGLLNNYIAKNRHAFVCTRNLVPASYHDEMSRFWYETKTHLHTKEIKKGQFISEL